MKQLLFSILFCLLPMLSQQASAEVSFSAGELSVSLDAKGHFTAITISGQSVLQQPDTYPLLVACHKGQLIQPKSLRSNGDKLIVTLTDGKSVTLQTSASDKSLCLEVTAFPTVYDAIVLCPVAVTLHEVVGDVIGVAQGQGLAFGMQALNSKTSAGVPSEYGKAFTDAFYQDKGNSAEVSTGAIEPIRLAAVDCRDFTFFQFSCRNRSRLEYRRVNNVDNAMVLPVKGADALVTGTKIALFGCKADQALNRIGDIELEHHLPHPMFDGEWGKTARAAMKSYLITDFGEDNLDFVMEKAKRAGFKYVYHGGPFEDWGHFRFSESFTKSGDEGVRRMVQRAAAEDIKLGVHTLSNFTTTNDAYVTPVPSKHLLKQGVLQLTDNIDATQTDIRIKRSSYFSVPLTLNALQIGDELITYGQVDSTATDDMVLKGCTRGAFHTTAAAHAKSVPLYKLWDYPYRTLFPDFELQDSFADRLAEVYNKTGLCQTSFDGLEGCSYTGLSAMPWHVS